MDMTEEPIAKSRLPTGPFPDDALGPEDIKFTKEDALLYVFCALLLIFVGVFFWRTQSKLEDSLMKEWQKTEAVAPAIAATPDPNPDGAPALQSAQYAAYLRTQEMISSRRYQHGARILLTTSTRKNTGFLVGTMLALLGCIIVVRRVRKMPITADFAASERAKLRVITSSPGVFVTLLGALIILSTIIRYDSFEIADAVIQPPGAGSTIVTTAPNPAPSTSPGAKVLTAEERDRIQRLLEEADKEIGEKK
jgi:hypothetical protein